MRVLVVGPDDGWACHLVPHLERQGAEVEVISDPKSAKGFSLPEVAFVDLTLPGAVDLLKQLVQGRPRPLLFAINPEEEVAAHFASALVLPLGGEFAKPNVLKALADAALDISRVHREAREVHQRAELLSDLPWFGVYILDEDLRFSYVSSHTAQLVGRDARELIGVRVDTVVHPEDRARVVEVLRDKCAGHEYPPYSVRLLKADGSPVWAEVFSRRAEIRGRPVVIGLVREVEAERRRDVLQGTLFRLVRDLLAEEAPQAILQRVADAITACCGFRRAVISLYDLTWPDPLEAPVHEVIISGLTEEEKRLLLSSKGMPPEQRRSYFSEEFRLGPEAYYVPVHRNPFELQGLGIPGTVEMEGWSPLDLLFIPLRARGRIIGHISLDDPLDPSAPTPETLEPVTHLAAIAALVVERAYDRELRRRHERHLTAVHRMAPQLMRAATAEEAIQRAVGLIAEELGYAFAGGGMVEGDEVAPFWFKRGPVDELHELGKPIPGDRGHVSRALQERRPQLVRDVRDETCPVGKDFTLRSVLVVPVLVDEEPLAVLVAGEEQPFKLTELDQDSLMAVANLCTTVIRVIHARERLAGLYELAHALSRGGSREEIIRSVVEALRDRFDFDYCAFFKATPEGLVLGELEVVEDVELSPDVRLGWHVPPDRGVVSWVAKHRAPVLLGDAPSDPRYLPGNPEIRSELAVPVMAGEELFGVLNVESRTPGAFGPEELATLQAVGGQLAVALAGLTAREKLREMALRDPLTGLYNRRFLDEAVVQEVARARRYRRPLAFLYIDVDGFREVNNTLGHLKGDEVLRRVAQFLKENVREADYVFRVGGDEFLVLLPETDGEAEAVAQRLRDGIKDAVPDLELPIGLSIGIMTWHPDEEFDLDVLLSEADARMYEDKRTRHSD
jgi:diguanylate cyclase (GGDEF)-like protein/PAS domain S-box-containing protein